MTGSHLQQQYMVFCYLLLWASRIRGVIRRVRQPHLRGEGWFFDVPVEADFYRGPGRLILRGYCGCAWPSPVFWIFRRLSCC